MEHNLSRCPKEKDRLQKEAEMRGEKLLGSGKSTKRNSQQDGAEGAVADDDSGCFMCFALGKSSWHGHSPDKCFTKDDFTKRLCDPEQSNALLEAEARKPRSPKRRNGSDRMNAQLRAGILQEMIGKHRVRKVHQLIIHSKRSDNHKKMQQMQQMQQILLQVYR
jgi:hypothetical protein